MTLFAFSVAIAALLAVINIAKKNADLRAENARLREMMPPYVT